VLVPIPADPTLGKGGIDRGGDDAIEALADRVIAQIARLGRHPGSRRTRRAAPHRRAGRLRGRPQSWKGSALGPAHTLRQSAFFRSGNASRKVENLFYAGSSTIPGIGLPMCLISAELVVKRVRGMSARPRWPESVRAGRTFRSAKPAP
jgi:phytoene dehydrogenase-like protein